MSLTQSCLISLDYHLQRSLQSVDDMVKRRSCSVSRLAKKAWGPAGSHVAVFAQQLHPPALILSPARPLRHGGMPQLLDDVVHRLCGGLDGRRTGRTTQTAISGPVPLVEIEIDKWNILQLDVFPDIDFGPVKQGMNSDMSSRRERGFELIPQFGRLIPKVPIAVLVPRRKIPLLCPGPFLVGANTPESPTARLEPSWIADADGRRPAGAGILVALVTMACACRGP